MTAGRELDALIAEKWMGLSPVPAWGQDMYSRDNGAPVRLPHYSTDIAAAWLVVEKLGLTVIPIGNGRWWSFVQDAQYDWYDYFEVALNEKYGVIADTAPHAICLAAMKAQT